jgi:prepilin-type N-terminal cleavage/methylation domain-containing protein
MSLIELMIALLVLAIGLGAINVLLVTAIRTNNRNNRDTTATLLAQKVIEQIASVNPASPNNVTITDCAGNTWTVSTVSGAAPSGAGATLVTSVSSPYYGGIDQTQSYSSIPAGYAMQYVDCSTAGGIPATYDVRWNIVTLRPGYTRLITAAARLSSVSANQLGGPLFAIPVNLRTIGAAP